MIKNKELRTTVALITESKVIQLFCITDSLTVPIYQFRNFFDADAGVNFTPKAIIDCPCRWVCSNDANVPADLHELLSVAKNLPEYSIRILCFGSKILQ